jgi:hypothetical protein
MARKEEGLLNLGVTPPIALLMPDESLVRDQMLVHARVKALKEEISKKLSLKNVGIVVGPVGKNTWAIKGIAIKDGSVDQFLRDLHHVASAKPLSREGLKSETTPRTTPGANITFGKN